MKIRGTLKGDMIGFALKHNPENGARFASIKIAANCDQNDCKELFGEELERVAFGSLVVSRGGEDEGAAGVSFGYKILQPSLICEFHEIKIAGHTEGAQPVIKSITPVKDKAEVTVAIEFPVLIGKDQAKLGAMGIQFGELVQAEFDPSQQEMDLDGDANSPGGGVVITRGAFGNPQPVITGG